jgi:hypothetical protein
MLYCWSPQKPHDPEDDGLKTRRSAGKYSLKDTESYFTIFIDDIY